MNDKLSELAKCFDHKPFILNITEQRFYGYKWKKTQIYEGKGDNYQE